MPNKATSTSKKSTTRLLAPFSNKAPVKCTPAPRLAQRNSSSHAIGNATRQECSTTGRQMLHTGPKKFNRKTHRRRRKWPRRSTRCIRRRLLAKRLAQRLSKYYLIGVNPLNIISNRLHSIIMNWGCATWAGTYDLTPEPCTNHRTRRLHGEAPTRGARQLAHCLGGIYVRSNRSSPMPQHRELCHKHRPIRALGVLLATYLLLWFCLIVNLWISLINSIAPRSEWSAEASANAQHNLTPLAKRAECRSREQDTLPLPAGCRSRDCPTKRNVQVVSQYSRPGPKSGVGRLLTILLIILRCQISHGVRVPTLSVGVGEGNPQAQTSIDDVPKTNGIQVSHGKQDPTHDWSKCVKRLFNRACHRAAKHGQASYKGRTLTIKNAPDVRTHGQSQRTSQNNSPQRRLQVFC